MEPITFEEANEMRELLAIFYGAQARQWKINAEVYEVFGDLVRRSKTCTTAVHLLPRPYDGAPAARWAMRQVRQGLTRYFKSDPGKHYVMCMRAAALTMRSEFALVTHQGM